MSLEQPALSNAESGFILAEGEELQLVTQGQEIAGKRPIEVTLYVTNSRLLTRPHSSPNVRETALFAEVETARLERRSMITGVVNFDSRQFMVPQIHGSDIVTAHHDYLAAAQQSYPSIPLRHQHDVESAISLILKALEPATDQEQYLSDYVDLVDLDFVSAGTIAKAMAQATWLPETSRTRDKANRLMALAGYLVRKKEIEASRGPLNGILPTTQSFSRAAAVALSEVALRAVARSTGEMMSARNAAYAAVFGYGLGVWGGAGQPPLR